MILDHTGRKIQLRQIEFIKTEMIVDGIEHTGFHVKGTDRGWMCPSADLTERVKMDVLEKLTEEFSYLGEPWH